MKLKEAYFANAQKYIEVLWGAEEAKDDAKEEAKEFRQAEVLSLLLSPLHLLLLSLLHPLLPLRSLLLSLLPSLDFCGGRNAAKSTRLRKKRNAPSTVRERGGC